MNNVSVKQSVECGILTQSTGDVESLISRSSSQEKNVGKIVDKIMAEHYNGISDQITFEDLMDWPMWQTFMKIFSKCTNCSGLM